MDNCTAYLLGVSNYTYHVFKQRRPYCSFRINCFYSYYLYSSCLLKDIRTLYLYLSKNFGGQSVYSEDFLFPAYPNWLGAWLSWIFQEDQNLTFERISCLGPSFEDSGAGRGNRTPTERLEISRSTIKLYPPALAATAGKPAVEIVFYQIFLLPQNVLMLISMKVSSVWDKVKYILQILILAGVYFLAAKFGLSLAIGVKQVTLVWPPTGIAIAALLLFNKRLWPGILIGAFLANVTTHETITIASQIAIGNTLEALAGWFLLNKFGFDKEFQHIEDIVKFMLWGAIVPTLVSATIGTTALVLGGTIGWQIYGQTWLTWWLGDTVGAIIFAPLILSLKDIKVFPFSFRKLLEFVALVISTAFTSILVFTGYVSDTFSMYPTKYLVFPFMIWAALRFGVPGATWISLLISVISILGFAAGSGPFSNLGSPTIGLTLLQLLMAVFSVTSIILAAAIEERKRSEGKVKVSEQRFRSLIENSYEAIILVDAKATIMYSSPSVKRILGFSPSELEKTNGFNLIYKDDKTYLVKTLASLILTSGKTVQVENRIVRKDGVVRWMEAVGTNLLQEEGVGGIVINFRDITDHKKIDEVKTEFVSLAAHELRSPLSNIRWYTESLLKIEPKLSDKPEKYVNEIYASTLKMASLVNLLLNVSKVELGKLVDQPELVDLARLTRDLLQNIKPKLRERDIKLTESVGGDELNILVDPNLVKIIIENIVGNAVKYTPDRGKISVSMKLIKDNVHIEIKDSGVGIPKGQQDKIFTKLFRADNVKKRYPDGTGLGLYLVKAVVDKLEGKIWFESTEEKGTTFFVEFPNKKSKK